MGEAAGSDKHFSFRIEGTGERIHIFEGAIDLLSYATIRKINGERWNSDTVTHCSPWAAYMEERMP